MVHQVDGLCRAPTPKAVNLTDQAVSMAVIAGFSETKFTKPGDEVVGTLSVVGILAGKGPVPIGTRTDHLPSSEEVQYALNLLGECWATQIDHGGGMMAKLNCYRISPMLQTIGFGLLRFTGAHRNQNPFKENPAEEGQVVVQLRDDGFADFVAGQDAIIFHHQHQAHDWSVQREKRRLLSGLGERKW